MTVSAKASAEAILIRPKAYLIKSNCHDIVSARSNPHIHTHTIVQYANSKSGLPYLVKTEPSTSAIKVGILDHEHATVRPV